MVRIFHGLGRREDFTGRESQQHFGSLRQAKRHDTIGMRSLCIMRLPPGKFRAGRLWNSDVFHLRGWTFLENNETNCKDVKDIKFDLGVPKFSQSRPGPFGIQHPGKAWQNEWKPDFKRKFHCCCMTFNSCLVANCCTHRDPVDTWAKFLHQIPKSRIESATNKSATLLQLQKYHLLFNVNMKRGHIHARKVVVKNEINQ